MSHHMSIGRAIALGQSETRQYILGAPLPAEALRTQSKPKAPVGPPRKHVHKPAAKLPKYERWLLHAVVDGLEDGHCIEDIAADTGLSTHEVVDCKRYLRGLVGREGERYPGER